MPDNSDDRVSRRRYEREKRARTEAEYLLEQKSRELYEANVALSQHSEQLEHAVFERTAELRLALERAEQASSARSRFIATMSHEIRTPLAGLLGMIDLLSLDETDPGKLDLLNNAKVSGSALNRIVNDVLDFSKMEAGLYVFENESVDIRALVKSILMLAQTNLTGKDRVVEALIDNSVPRLFSGDATRIRQVVSNLVSNAVRYSEKGPITISATTEPHPKGALLRLEVEDHGVGIEQDQIENLFKDFSQVANPLTAAAQGTGLGLAISKRIVEGCKGTIGVDSKIGVGSVFWIELPIEAIAEAEAPSAEKNVWAPSAEAVTLEGRRILLAEDNSINQKLLLTYLTRMGIKTVLAENGRIALEKFSPGEFDLILMDVAMPEMDGLSATRHIRERYAPNDIPPIMVLTAHVMDAIEEDAAQVGIEDVLTKPIPFEDLRTAIQNALTQREAKKASVGDASEAPEPSTNVNAVLGIMAGDVAKDLTENFTPEDLAGLIESYVEQVEGFVVSISQHYHADRADLASSDAHSLKGSSLLLGFHDIGSIAAEIEKSIADITSEDLARSLAAISEHLYETKTLLGAPDSV